MPVSRAMAGHESCPRRCSSASRRPVVARPFLAELLGVLDRRDELVVAQLGDFTGPELRLS
jgi:hypothetical protein